MPDRPRFITELRTQLAEANIRLDRRRRRTRNVVRAVSVLGVVAMAGIAAGWFVQRDPGETIAVGIEEPRDAAVSPQPDVEVRDEEPTVLSQPAEDVTGSEWGEAASVIGGESLPGVFWTGSEVVVLRTENGGGEVIGERWDPITNAATAIASSGLTWRVGAAMVWTGTEVLVVGGSSGIALNQIGAAYDPASDSWRALSDPPKPDDTTGPEIRGPGIWTGAEMVVWRSSLAYNPATDSWRSIANSPLSPRVKPVTEWTGTELFVWGGCFSEDSQCDETNTGLLRDGAIYNPGTDEWSEVPETLLGGAVHAVAGWSGSEVFVFTTDPGVTSLASAAAYDPVSEIWREVASPPLAVRRLAAGIWSNSRFVVWGGRQPDSLNGFSDGASYDPVTDRWTSLPQSPEPGRWLHSMITAEDLIYVSATARTGRPLWFRNPLPSTPRSEDSPEQPDQADPVAGADEELRDLDGRLLDIPNWLSPRGGHSVTWTGTELLVWGGWSDERASTIYADGAAFDPASNLWRPLSPSPLSGRGYHAAAWTGDRLLISGGQTGQGVVVDDGAVYDPVSDSWQMIPPSGKTSAATTPPPVESVWTGELFVLWFRDQGVVVGYDPVLDRWSDLPELNLRRDDALGELHWLGTQLVALAGEGPGVMAAATLRPGEDQSWLELPPVDFANGFGDPFPSNSAIADGQLVVWSRSGRNSPTFVLDPGSRRWDEIPTIPINACEGHFEPLSLGRTVLAMDTCLGETAGGAALYDATSQTWEVLQAGPDGRANLGMAVWTGTEILVIETTCCFGAPDRQFEWSGQRYVLPDG